MRPAVWPFWRAALTGAAFTLAAPLHGQDLEGHGGPVGALAVTPDHVLSGSFDTRAILWDRAQARAVEITRFHDGNVTAVAFLQGGAFVTAGQDGRIALWEAGAARPYLATDHAPSAIAALDVAPDARTLAAGFRDGQILTLSLPEGVERWHQAHSDRITGLGYLASGDLVSVGGDQRLMRWSPEFSPRAQATLPALPNGLAVSQGRLAVIFADGALRMYSETGDLLPEHFLTDRPLVALATSAMDIVAAAIDGTVWRLDATALTQEMSFPASDGPIWALALDDSEILTAGHSGVIRRWAREDGAALGRADPQQAASFDDGSRGAEIWRSCAVCHSLEPDDHNRAGPSLHGIFGMRIASQPGFDYSGALRDMDIIWTEKTVAELFEYGPDEYTPGSRMPDQRISDPADRAALVEFLARTSE